MKVHVWLRLFIACILASWACSQQPPFPAPQNEPPAQFQTAEAAAVTAVQDAAATASAEGEILDAQSAGDSATEALKVGKRKKDIPVGVVDGDLWGPAC